MNKYQNAIGIIKACGLNIKGTEEAEQVENTIIEALEKQIQEPKTNYDRIRNMNLNEMAKFMNECGHDFPPYCEYIKAASGRCDHNCLKCAKQWLESEVEGK